MARIKIPYRGIIEIVGGHDVGKTIAALQTVTPYDKTVFVDDDEKGSGMVEQIMKTGVKFEEYINVGKMRAEFGKTQTAEDLLKGIVYPVAEKITASKHEVIIYDTWRIVYQAARMYVDRHQSEFRDVVNFRGNSQIIQGLVSRVARNIERTLLNNLAVNSELVIATHHLKANYVNGVVVGDIPESSRTFAEVANMRIWLKRNPNSKVPIMLFLKRPTVPKLENGKMKFVNIVPIKVTPNEKDESIWDAIARYEKDPIESRPPTKEETPTAEELAMISGVLTKEQQSYVLEVLKLQKEETEAIVQIVTETAEREMKSPKTGAELIARALKEFKLNGEQLKEFLGKDIGELMSMNSSEIEDVWSLLIEEYS